MQQTGGLRAEQGGRGCRGHSIRGRQAQRMHACEQGTLMTVHHMHDGKDRGTQEPGRARKASCTAEHLKSSTKRPLDLPSLSRAARSSSFTRFRKISAGQQRVREYHCSLSTTLVCRSTAIPLCLRDLRIEARPACAGTMAHMSVQTSMACDRPALISPTQVTVPPPRLSPCFRLIKPCRIPSNSGAMLMLIVRLHRRYSDPSQSAVAPLPAVQHARRHRMDRVGTPPTMGSLARLVLHRLAMRTVAPPEYVLICQNAECHWICAQS